MSEKDGTVIRSTGDSPHPPWAIIFGSVGGALGVFVLLAVVLCICSRCRKKSQFEQLKKSSKKYSALGKGPIQFVLPKPTVSINDVQLPPELQYDSSPEKEVNKLSRNSQSFPADLGSPGQRSPGSGRRSPGLGRRAFSAMQTPSVDELNFDLYNEYGDDFSQPSSACGLGKLCFSVFYDTRNECVMVDVIRANYVKPKGLKDSADPYVKLCLWPDKTQKQLTKVIRGTVNPVFDESFRFSITANELKDKLIRMTVCDYDRFSRQVVIGYVMFPLKELQFVSGSGGISEIWRDIEDDVAGRLYRGELLFSLCYNPRMSAVVLAILKGKDIKTSDADTETSDLCVKVTQLTNGKPVKTRRTKTQREGSNPVFNEEFVFQTTSFMIDQTHFVITVCSRNAFGINRPVGKTTVGSVSYATGQGLEHWTDMKASPRSTVAQWHILL